MPSPVDLFRLFALSVLIIGVCVETASPNGFGENGAYKLRSPNDRSVRLKQLEMEELKKGGFFNSFGSGGAGGMGAADDYGNMGPTVNCIVTSTTQGNSSGNSVVGETGSLSGVSDVEIGATSTGNTSDNFANGESASTTNDQVNKGSQNSSVNGSSISSRANVDRFESGEFDGAVNSNQDIDDGVLSATVSSSPACGDLVLN